MHTLNLMSRAGLIHLSDVPPPRRSMDDDDETFQKAVEKHQLTQWVDLRSDHHLDAHEWRAKVEPIRAAQRLDAQNSFDALRNMLAGEVEASSVLVNAYRVAGFGIDPAGAIYPQSSCGGCAVCRSQTREVWDGIDPIPVIRTWTRPSTELAAWARPGRVTVVTCDDADARTHLLKFLVDRGVCLIVDPGASLGGEDLISLHGRSRAPLLVHASPDLLFAPPLAAVCLAPVAWTELPTAWLQPSEQERIVVSAAHHTTAGGASLDLHDIQWRAYAIN